MITSNVSVNRIGKRISRMKEIQMTRIRTKAWARWLSVIWMGMFDELHASCILTECYSLHSVMMKLASKNSSRL